MGRFFFALLGGLVPAVAMAACKLDAVEMPITMIGQRAIATVEINAHRVPLIVDSGAFFSSLTDAAAAQLQLPLIPLPMGMQVHGLVGAIDARMARVKHLQFLKGEIPNVDFIVGGNEAGSGSMGLLGRNLLAFTDTEYDLANGVIRFMFPNDECSGQNMAYWAGQTPVSELALLRDTTSKLLPAIKAIATLNGKAVRVLFDTGAQSLVSLSSARRAGLADADMKPIASFYGAGRGEAKAWIAPFRQFEIGGEAIQNNQIPIADIDNPGGADMLLGIDFFLSHRLYVSKSQRRMFFTYNGGAVFRRNVAAATDTPDAPGAAASGASAPESAALPTDASGFARRGAAFAARGDFVRALADLNRACEMGPDVADHFTRRGLVHEALKQAPQALQDYDTALHLDPALAEPRVHRAGLRMAANDRDGARDDLQALDQALAPESNARRDLAQLYGRLDRWDQALPQWSLWIQSHRNEVDLHQALNARCWARVLLRVELDKALDDCNAAVDAQPKNANYLDSRAWLRLRRAELRDAVSDFDRAIVVRPEAALALYGRGMARLQLGDAERGRVDIEAARKLRPTVDAEMARHGLGAEVKPPTPGS